jgi:CRP/FNR family transcriptional regulator, cyclic AMP receptor protein
MNMSNSHFWIEALGYLGALLTFGTYSMRTMVPLRVCGIAANTAFIAYGLLGSVYPPLVLHACLLPLNAWRLREMLRLLRDVRQAAQGNLSIEWLKPYSRRRRVAAGELLWRRGDAAQEMLFVLSGRLLVVEPGVELGAGDVLGEVAFVTPDSTRTQSVQCTETAELLVISYSELRQQYFQNPRFGFWFMQLASRRLLHDADATRVTPARASADAGAQPAA